MMTNGIYSMTAFIHSHTDTTKLRDSQAAMVNFFSHFWLRSQSNPLITLAFSESDVSSLLSQSDDESDNESSNYSNNAPSDTDVDDSQRATPSTLHNFQQHRDCFC